MLKILIVIFLGSFSLSAHAITCESYFKTYSYFASQSDFQALVESTQAQISTYELAESGKLITILYDTNRVESTKKTKAEIKQNMILFLKDFFTHRDMPDFETRKYALQPLSAEAQNQAQTTLENLAKNQPVIAIDPYKLLFYTNLNHQHSYSLYEGIKKLNSRFQLKYESLVEQSMQKYTKNIFLSAKTSTITLIGLATAYLPTTMISALLGYTEILSLKIAIAIPVTFAVTATAVAIYRDRKIDKQAIASQTRISTEVIDVAIQEPDHVIVILPDYMRDRIEAAFQNNSDYQRFDPN